jgi:molybdopterin-guanine dinucleotide biosynthesis protein A
MPASAVVLAGGLGRRLGLDKALLRLDDRTLLVRAVAVCSLLSDDVQVVGRPSLAPDVPPVRLTPDTFPGAGPLGGLHAGLIGARHELVICAACDYPFLSSALLRLLLDHGTGRDAAVPLVGDTPHVLVAVYSRQILPAVEARLRARSYRVRSLLEDLDVSWIDEPEVRSIDPDLHSLLNVNTPQDWVRAQALAGHAPA